MAGENEGRWAETFEHESITEENREAFVKSNKDYATQEAALIGGYNARTGLNNPYRVPEDMDSLDDAGKADFTAKAQKALGIEHAADVAGLSEVNLKKGLPEGSPYDENFATAFKQFAVDKKIPKSVIEPLAEFFNLASIKATGDYQAKQAADFATDKQAADEALVAHADFGTKEKLDEQNVLLHRALVNHLGLNAEESNEMAEFLRDREGATNPVLRRVLLKHASLAAEGSTHEGDGSGGGGGGVKQPSPYEAKKARWPKSPETEWGNPADKWEDMDIQTRKALGYKEAK